MCMSQGLIDRRGDLGIEDDAFLDRQRTVDEVGGDADYE